jgi:hypothetical protein
MPTRTPRNALELNRDRFLALVRGSSGEDWLFFPENRTFSFCRDLLIRITPENGPKSYELMYGVEKMGAVDVEANWSMMTPEQRIPRVLIQGAVDVELRGIRVGTLDAVAGLMPAAAKSSFAQ